MQNRSSSLLIVSAGALLWCVAPAKSMNHNLAVPFADKNSPPQTPYLAFYSPQDRDLLFSPKELTKRGTVEVICQAGLRSVGLSYTLHRDMVLTPFQKGEAEPLSANRYRIEIPVRDLPAGFYELRVTLDTGMPVKDPKDPRPVRGVCAFGWRADEMPLRETRPQDFKAFWDRAKAKLAAIPLDARDETPLESFDKAHLEDYNLQSACLPADYDPKGHKVEEVESNKVSFAGPDGGRVYGWLAKPKGAGPFPAMLVLPGAGFNARPRPLEHARHGYLALDIQIHGQDVDLPKYESLPGYNDGQAYEPTDAYYFYNVHLRVLQALNYLASRPDVDPKHIVVVGGSQGGRLGIVAAGLDSRVSAVVSCIANSPNYPALVWAAKCNGLDKLGDNPSAPEFKDRPKFDGMDLKDAPPAVDTPAGRTIAYYDPMNFAPDVHCPVLMNAGLIDPVSPPSSVWAVLERLGTKDKTMVPLPGMGHDWSAEFDREAWRWLARVQYKK